MRKSDMDIMLKNGNSISQAHISLRLCLKIRDCSEGGRSDWDHACWGEVRGGERD